MGPVDLIISESSYAGWIRGEKGGAEIEASMPRPIRTPRSAPLRARPQIPHPAESASNKSVYQTRCFRRSVARRSSKPERSLDVKTEWIESTEGKLLPVNEEILWSRTAHNRSAKVNRKRHQLLLHSKPRSILFLRRVIFQASTISERRIARNTAPDRLICCSRIPRDAKFWGAREAGRTAAFGWDGAWTP